MEKRGFLVFSLPDLSSCHYLDATLQWVTLSKACRQYFLFTQKMCNCYLVDTKWNIKNGIFQTVYCLIVSDSYKLIYDFCVETPYIIVKMQHIIILTRVPGNLKRNQQFINVFITNLYSIIILTCYYINVNKGTLLVHVHWKNWKSRTTSNIVMLIVKR